MVINGWGDQDTFLAETFVFDTNTESWTKWDCTGDLPKKTCQSSAILYRHRYVILYGGAYRSEATAFKKYGDYVHDISDIYVLDITLRVWARTKAAGPTSSVHAMVPLSDDGSLSVVVGGMHNDLGKDTPNFHEDFQMVKISF
jgi:hypothetical protein